MDFVPFTYDVCRRYVLDQKGLVGADVANLVLGWIRARDIERLSSCPDHIPCAYSDRDRCRFSRQVAAFFKKNKAFSDRMRCSAAALQSFLKAEKLCRLTNKRLDHYYLNRDRLPGDLDRILMRAEGIMDDILGDISHFLEKLPELVRVTAGATATRSRRESLPYRKVSMRNLSATPSAIPYLRALGAFYGFQRVSFRERLSNRVETVPKNWKTDRTIACEPEGNLFLQLAFDEFVKARLRRKTRVDLSDQFENQYLAKVGSIDDSLSTIDLSMASDTVSLNAAAWLLPVKWYEYLVAVRAPKGDGFGQEFTYAKLSSMGNGATFALETLIFTALSIACGSRRYAVYGDDIIIEKEIAPDLLAVLRFLGFRVNKTKSYVSGPFRESCGADWFNGTNVTPFYLQCNSSMKVEFCHMVNGLASLTHPGGELENLLLSIVDNEKLPFVPWNESSISGVWISPHHAYAEKLIRTRHWVSTFKAFTPKMSKLSVWDSRTLFLWHLDARKRATRTPIHVERGTNPLLSYGVVEDFLPESCIVRSSVPTFTHKYVRKWVGWFPPTVATPDHLYWWSDSLVRRKADKRE